MKAEIAAIHAFAFLCYGIGLGAGLAIGWVSWA